MKKSIKYTLLALAATALTVGFGSCSDWTDTESLDIKNPTLEDQNSKLYAKYLADLKAYKESDHKVLVVSFDNPSRGPWNQAERLTAVPDSVDYIALNNAGDLHADTKADIKKVQEKSTRVVWTINYNAIEEEWEEMAKLDPSLTEEQALAWMGKKFDKVIDNCQQSNAAGIMVDYNGKSTVSMTEPVLTKYDNRQKNMLDKVVAWKNSNQGKSLVFYGNIQYLVPSNMQFLNSTDLYILKTVRATNGSQVTLEAYMGMQAGKDIVELEFENPVHTDRFVACVQMLPKDDPSGTVGYWSDEVNGKELAIYAGAQWSVEESLDFGRKGLMITNINSDYHNNTYKSIRNVISIMNPNK